MTRYKTTRNRLLGGFLAAAALCLIVGAATNPSESAVLWQENFNDAKPGTAYAGEAVVAADGGVDGSQCILANYHLVRGEKNSGSNRMVHNSVFENADHDEVTLNYRIKFDNDFETTMGGKFMGVGPKNFVTGGRNMKPDGWSARVVMVGRVPHVYVYDQEKSYKFGRRVPPLDETPLTKDEWHDVSLHVRLNTAGDTNDGLVEVWVDGKKRAEFADARLRGVVGPDTLPTTMLFHTFLGGTGVGEPLGTQHARFDDVEVRAGKAIR